MNARLFVPTATLFAALGAALSVVACSAAPGGDPTGKTDDSLTSRAAAIQCGGAFERSTRVCSDPGEGPHGTTVCGQECVVATGPVCNPPVAHTCGATLAVPPALAGCSEGMAITTYPKPSGIATTTNVWLCPNGTTVPWSIAPLPGFREKVAPISATQPFCSTCVGALPPNMFFIVQWYDSTGPIGGGCKGPCALGVGGP